MSANRRAMTNAQWLNRYSGWRGSLRLWRDWLADVRHARALRNRPRYQKPYSFTPGAYMVVDGPADHNRSIYALLAAQQVYGSAYANAAYQNFRQNLGIGAANQQQCLSSLLGIDPRIVGNRPL